MAIIRRSTDGWKKIILTLKRASISHRSGKERGDDYDLLADGVVVGRIIDHAVGLISITSGLLTVTGITFRS